MCTYTDVQRRHCILALSNLTGWQSSSSLSLDTRNRRTWKVCWHFVSLPRGWTCFSLCIHWVFLCSTAQRTTLNRVCRPGVSWKMTGARCSEGQTYCSFWIRLGHQWTIKLNLNFSFCRQNISKPAIILVVDTFLQVSDVSVWIAVKASVQPACVPSVTLALNANDGVWPPWY